MIDGLIEQSWPQTAVFYIVKCTYTSTFSLSIKSVWPTSDWIYVELAVKKSFDQFLMLIQNTVCDLTEESGK